MKRFNAVLAHWLWLPALVVALCVAQFTIWCFDRKPPFAVLSADPTIGVAGESVLLDMRVRRDIDRHCSVRYTRSLFDASGVRHDLEGEEWVTAAALERMQKRMPGRLRVSIPIPRHIAVGEAALVTSLRYECNPVHAIWPIEVTSVIPFEIVEATSK
jgi:hypothetical protein